MAAKARVSSKAAAPSKAKVSTKPAAPTPAKKKPPGAAALSPLNSDERLHRIDEMGQRIEGYIRYMCQITALTGTSAEVKERAVAAFYEQMVHVERQLGKIHDELRLE